MHLTKTIKAAAGVTLAGLAVGGAAAAPASASDCGDWESGIAGIGHKLTYTSDCSVFGSSSTRVGYAWATEAGTNTRICVEALGFRPVGGSPLRKEAHWYPMGCGTSGSGTVPWGATAATPKVRAQTQLGFLGGLFVWRH